MRCRFVQMGDIHLGTQQYDSPERLNDFGKAWLFACERVARTRPDFVVCTGDLFNRFTINPTTFDQALAGLSMLREAGVPIVDIAGNHDRARYGEGRSWLESFADQGLLTYLDVELGPDGPHLTPVEPGQQRGGFVEWSGCRITGMRYLGASTERALEGLETELDRLGHDAFNLLVVHAGLEGVIPHFNAELTPAAVDRLRGRIDYLALGHIHKHYAIGNLVYNAGSLETWALNEWEWPRGLLEVEIDTDREQPVSLRLIDVPRRPFVILRVNVGDFDTPDALLHYCWDRLQVEQNRLHQDRPVAVIYLYGRLRFDASELPVNRLEEACRQLLDPLMALVREQYDLNDFGPEVPVDEDEPVDRAYLERAVLQAQLAADERFAPNAEPLSRLALDLKERALRDGNGVALLQTLRGGLDRLNLHSAEAPTEEPSAAPESPTEEPAATSEAAEAVEVAG